MWLSRPIHPHFLPVHHKPLVFIECAEEKYLQFTAKNFLRLKNKDRMLILFLCPHLTDGCLISADELTIWPKVVNRIMASSSHNYSAKLLSFYLCLKYCHLSASMAGIWQLNGGSWISAAEWIIWPKLCQNLPSNYGFRQPAFNHWIFLILPVWCQVIPFFGISFLTVGQAK